MAVAAGKVIIFVVLQIEDRYFVRVSFEASERVLASKVQNCPQGSKKRV